MATKKSSCMSIRSLNGDCMRRVFFYLRLIDRFKFALACNSFDEIFASYLRKDVFIMRELIQTFTLDEVKQILERFGPYIKRLSLRQTIDSSNIDYYNLVSQYCHSIETIELQRNLKPYQHELSVYKDILLSSKDLRSVQVFQNRKLDRELRSDREILFYHFWGCGLLVIISSLKDLHTLHYSDSSLIGTRLSNLKNLTELNIAYCSNFSSKDFVEICQVVKLRTLNINNCTKLDNAALEALAETQTELRHLTISNNLLAHNYEVVGRLKGLVELILIDKNSKKLCELMYELSNCHRDDLETLKISSNCILFNSDFRQNLLSFRNLKVFYPSNVVAPEDDYLIEIGTKFPKLHKLKICVGQINTSEGFVNMLKMLKNLTELILDYSRTDENERFSVDFLRRIVDVRRSMNCGLLTIHLLQGTVAHDVFRTSSVEQPSSSSIRRPPSPPEATTLLDLNDDCIFHLFLYLPLMERLKFAYACDDFDDIVITFLKFNIFSVSECRNYFTVAETEQILSRFGPYVKQLNLDETIDSRNIEKIYKILGDYCCDINAIELHYPARVEFEAYLSSVYRILSTAKHIQSVRIERKVFTDDWPNPWYYRVLEEKLCETISSLAHLKNLHLTHFYKASGKYLNKLTRLKHLNIEYCINFKSEHFISLCQSIRLKSLNIDNCTFLNDETLEVLVQTQTELEQLTINTEFDARNFKIVGRLRNLKELVVYDYYGGRTLDELLDEIVQHHRDDLRVLEISTNAPNTIENHKIFQQHLLALCNLKVLCLPYECLAESYLIGIGTKLLKLERLRFDIDKRKGHDRKDNPAGGIGIVREARNLWPVSSGFIFCVELLRPIVITRRHTNCKLLVVYLDIENIAENLYESREYRDNLDVLRVEAVL